MVSVGLVGCGAIGSGLARTIQRTYRGTARIVALHDQHQPSARRLQRALRHHPPVCSLRTLIQRSQLVIEASSMRAAGAIVRQVLRANRSVVVMSVGGLLHDQSWRKLAGRSRGRVYVPSGALAGLDGVKGMAVGRIRRISLVTSKPPKSLSEAPYLKRRGIRLKGRRPTVVFEGSARSVVRAFPQNTNVAATLALASGAAARRIRVRVVADPTLRVNRHELEVIGDCGRLSCRIESAASRDNPKTSEQAIRSAAATLKEIFGAVSIGT